MITLFRSIFAPPRHLILLFAGLWLGLLLAERRCERHHISRDALNNVVFYGILGYALGGRLLYALENYPAFVQSPLSLFSLNLDLFDPLAALIVALTAGLLCGRRQRLPFWSTLDALTPVFASLAMGLALSHLAAGTAFGQPTTLPWGIELWNARRHPSQLYELIAGLLIFIVIWFQKAGASPGRLFLTFIALTATARLFLEAFRGDSTLIFGGLRLAQVIAWLVLVSTLLVYESVRKVKDAA